MHEWVLVGATIIYVLFTYRLARETTMLRKVETDPFIVIYLEPESTPMMRLRIKNIGKGPAYNISFDIEKTFREFFYMKDASFFTTGINYLPPDQEIFILAGYFKDFDEADFDVIPIGLKYYSHHHEEKNETIRLKWDFRKDTILETDPLLEISDVLKKLESQNRKAVDYYERLSNKKKLGIAAYREDSEQITLLFNDGLKKVFEKEDLDLHITKNGAWVDQKFVPSEVLYNEGSFDNNYRGT
jgi:hypothetical protein